MICPHCQEHNQVLKANSVCCYQCHQPFPDDTYLHQNILQTIPESKKSDSVVASLILAVGVGAVAGYGIENYFDKNRYPFELEYALVTNCASPEYSLEKMEKCACALREVQEVVKYDEAKQKDFALNFDVNLRNERCS